MKFEEFKIIFDQLIFQNDRSHLINNIATNKDRFVGLFRSTTPAAKLAQNVSQSREIRFGDAFERVIEKLLEEQSWTPLDKLVKGLSGETLSVDQLLLDETGGVVLVEQKVRDDHDSTKRHGQIQNFEKKIQALKSSRGSSFKSAFFYFIDPSLKKNRGFYAPKISEFAAKYGVSVYLAYGDEFFEKIAYPSLWTEITDHLERWRSELPQIPSLSFDSEPERTVSELIENTPPSSFLKLFEDVDIRREILPILFPDGVALPLLSDAYVKAGARKSGELASAIKAFLKDQNSLRS